VRSHLNGGGRAKIATVQRLGGGRQKVISLADAPDDVFHVANANTRRMRRRLTPPELRRAARKPWRRLAVNMQPIPSMQPVPVPSMQPAPSMQSAPTMQPVPAMQPAPTMQPVPSMPPVSTMQPVPAMQPVPTMQP